MSNKNMASLNGDQIQTKLMVLATANPETRDACELAAASFRSGEYDVIMQPEIEATVGTLSDAAPQLHGWDWIASILGL